VARGTHRDVKIREEKAVARRHKYAGASASISTSLDPGRIAEIAEQAAKQAETLQVMMRLEESTPGRLVYSARNRVVGGRIEFMTFEATLKESQGTRTVKTRILTYKQKRQWILVIPLPWRMMAWSNYKKFMYSLATGIKAADATAQTNVIELAQS
jgi:hypothetical protein